MPRHAVLASLLTLAAAVAAPSRVAAQAGEEAVMDAILRFFDAARTKDTAAVRAAFEPAARLTLLRPDPNGGVRVNVLTPDQFVGAVAGGSGIDEPVRNPKVFIDGDLASVWVEYQVRANGAVSHCGYDAFHLVRRTTGWKVLAIADSFRRSGCGAMWP